MQKFKFNLNPFLSGIGGIDRRDKGLPSLINGQLGVLVDHPSFTHALVGNQNRFNHSLVRPNRFNNLLIGSNSLNHDFTTSSDLALKIIPPKTDVKPSHSNNTFFKDIIGVIIIYRQM